MLFTFVAERNDDDSWATEDVEPEAAGPVFGRNPAT